MIEEGLNYKCTCFKCGHRWWTKTKELPKVCARCKTLKWNDDYLPPELQPLAEIQTEVTVDNETDWGA